LYFFYKQLFGPKQEQLWFFYLYPYLDIVVPALVYLHELVVRAQQLEIHCHWMCLSNIILFVFQFTTKRIFLLCFYHIFKKNCHPATLRSNSLQRFQTNLFSSENSNYNNYFKCIRYYPYHIIAAGKEIEHTLNYCERVGSWWSDIHVYS
jgi:hypothetical protein